MYMLAVAGQIEAHPAFTIALEMFDVAGAQRGSLGAGVELGGNLDIDFAQPGVFIEAIDRLVSGQGQAGQKQKAEQCGEGSQSHKSWRDERTTSGSGRKWN